jgi:hypothetical protein
VVSFLKENRMNINQLRDAGYKVRVHHLRNFKGHEGLYTRHDFEVQFSKALYSKLISPRGGKTVVELTLPNGTDVTDSAVCSMKDQYNRKLGLKIALGRAVAKALSCQEEKLCEV